MSIDLKEMRDRKQFADAEWKHVFDEGDEDLRYLNGHPFSPAEEDLWMDMYGPKPLATDQLSSHVNRVSNHVLAKPRGIKVHQASQRASVISAADRNDIIRGIEYTGGAQVAMLMAYRSMVETSYGVLGLTKRYKPGSRHMEMIYRAFPNRRQVVVDPTIVQPDGSDMEYAFVAVKTSKKEFERKYGKDAHSSSSGLGMDEMSQSSMWFQNTNGIEYVTECEYWCITKQRERLFYLDGPNGEMNMPESTIKKLGMGWNNDYLMIQDNLGGWQPYAQLAAMPDDEKPFRYEEVPEVHQYITNGYDILATTPWDTRQIPLVLMLGKQLFLNEGGTTKREILSLIRLARQPYKALCYVRSKQMLLAGMAPMNQWMVGEGQLSAGELAKLESSHRVMYGAIQYKMQMDNIVNPDNSKPLLPPPTRQSNEIEIQGLEIMAQSLIRDCSTAMGFANIPSALLDDKQKSGVALENINEMVDQGSSHFIDTYDKAGKQCGVIMNEEIDYLAANPRDFVAIAPDKKQHVLTVGRQAVDPRTKKTRVIDLGLSEDHDVTISVGPSADSLVEEAEKLTDQIMDAGALQLALQANPAIAGEVVAANIRGRDGGPGMDAIADLFSPPDKDSAEAKLQKAGTIIQQQQAALQEAGDYIPKLEERVRQLQSGIEKQVVANEGKRQDSLIDQQTTVWKAQFDALVKKGEDDRATDMALFNRILEQRLGEVRAENDHSRATEAMVTQQALQPPEPVASSAGQ